jgi:hypothetical protein
MLRVYHKRVAAASSAGMHLLLGLPWTDQSLHKMFGAIQVVMYVVMMLLTAITPYLPTPMAMEYLM